MTDKKVLKFLIISLVIAASTVLIPWESIRASGNILYQKLRVLNDMIRIINDTYVEEVDWGQTMEGAQRGLMEALDPHSIYIPAEELKKINESFRGNFEGIGIEFDILDNYITVINPIAGSPSDGVLQPGDKIIKINGKSAYKITQQEVFEKLRGPKGSRVDLEIRRPGVSKLIPVTIIRDKIPIYSVLAHFVMDDGTGYILLNRFSATTAKEFFESISTLKKQGMKRLLIDLRNNSGGYLDQVVKLVDAFLPGGEVIVSTAGRIKNANEVFYSHKKKDYYHFPVIVMINRGSASASEILAGAMQDLDRGLIVGETSFGKGLVQRQYPLRDGSAIRVTVARYYTPSGRLIQRPYKKGDSRDYYLELYDEKYGTVDSTKLKSLPAYKTKTGRTVYGGGGITPDIHLPKPVLISHSLAKLRSHPTRPFFEYATEYAIRHPELKKDWDYFFHRFEFSDAEVRDFLQSVDTLDLKLDSLELRKDWKYIKAYLKSQVAAKLWGRQQEYMVRTEIDNQVQEALKYFDQAAEIARRAGYEIYE